MGRQAATCCGPWRTGHYSRLARPHRVAAVSPGNAELHDPVVSSMEHQGIRYTVTQTANPRVWRWMVQFEGCAKIGTSPSRIVAIQHAIRTIDDAIGAKLSV
jgi:hypothetical protein